MKKALAPVGVGNATVDTVLAEDTVHPGDQIDAEVRVEGGESKEGRARRSGHRARATNAPLDERASR